MRKALLVGTVAIAGTLATAAGADGPRVSLVGTGPAPTVGQAWTAKLTVRPASFNGAVHVIATGPKRMDVRASGGHGSYRARLVFSAAGRWTLTARTGSSSSSLGRVQVRRAAAAPLTFVWPSSVEVEPSGSLLLVENGLRRLVRVVPATGRVTEIASLTKPYAVRRARSGSIFVTDGPELLRIDGTKAPVKVAEASTDIGPIAIAPNGDVYFATDTAIFRLSGGKGTPARIAAKTQLSGPHGLAVAADGSILVSDTGNHRILRIDPASGATASFAALPVPRGIEVATDGTVDVVDGATSRVVHFSRSGSRLGVVGPAFDDPYDLRAAPGGVLYVVESLASGDVRRVGPDGTATVVSGR
jgi:sugar lactone lactonase YvrE